MTYFICGTCSKAIFLIAILFIFFLAFFFRKRSEEIEGVQYIQSKRGCAHVLYDGNTYTPNEKTFDGQGSRSWKCSMYYRQKCKARLTTRRIGEKEFLRPSSTTHNHDPLYPTPETILL